jgi:hypothetical protein
MIKISRILIALQLLAVLNIFSQTNIGGVISSNTIWGLIGSPYIITSNTVIFPNVTLDVQPGVVVKFNAGTQLSVRGQLNINGSKTDSVIFTSSSATPNKSDWSGIKIENNLGGKVFANYCKGFYADMLFNVAYNSPDTVLFIKNSRFSQNNFVLYSYDPSTFKIIVDSSLFNYNSFCSIYSNYLTITNSKFYYNDKVVHGWSGPTVYIGGCYIYGSTTYAFNMSGTITNSVIKNNASGIKLRDDIVVTYDSIINNTKGLEITSINNITNNNVIHNYLNYNGASAYHTSNASIQLAYNCWGTSDSTAIENMIYDVYDNTSLGLVTFLPLDCVSSIGIKEIETKNNINIYPNPVEDILNIELDGNYRKIGIKIHNSLGELVKQMNYENQLDRKLFTINMEDLPSGLYFLNVTSGAIELNTKVVHN